MEHPFLVGDRLYLRALERKDLDGPYLDWINDPEVNRYLATGRFPQRRQDLEEYFERMTSSPDYAFFAIVDKETDEHIGNIKLGPIDWINRTSNFGTMIGESEYHGRGYGTEAMELLLTYAFEELNLRKVWDAALSCNEASLRKNEKAGLREEARLEEMVYRGGRYHDKVFVSITRDEYFARRSGEPEDTLEGSPPEE